MSDQTPQANRLSRPSWRDSRLVVGLFLVLLSTALGGWVISRADDSVPVYAAARDLVPGQPVGVGDVTRVDVRLGDGVAHYLPAGKGLPADLHVLRPVGKGELLADSMVGGKDRVETRLVSVQVDSTSLTGLAVGSMVDVYVNRPTGSAGPGGKPQLAGPKRELASASVATLPKDSGVLGGVSSQQPVQIAVPSDQVQTLVEAIDLGSRITLVPVPGTSSPS